MGNRASIPQNVREYFAQRGARGVPKIVETFGPNGWLPTPAHHSLSKGRILGLKRIGVTRVGLRCGAPPNGGQASTADFGIVEMLGASWASGEIEAPAQETPEPECKCSRDAFGVRVLAPNCPRHPSASNASVTFDGFAKPAQGFTDDAMDRAGVLPASSGPLPDADTRIRELALASLACHSSGAQLSTAQQQYRAGKLGLTADEIAEADRLYLELREAARENHVSPANASRWALLLPSATLDAIATRAALGIGPTFQNAGRIDSPAVTAAAQDAAPNVDVCETLIAIRAWAETMRANHAHYGIEALIAGCNAVLARPSRLRLDAPISPYIPS